MEQIAQYFPNLTERQVEQFDLLLGLYAHWNEQINVISRKDLENFFLNSNIDINYTNFFIAILLSLVLAYVVKYTYIKAGRALNDKHHFSDTFHHLQIEP